MSFELGASTKGEKRSTRKGEGTEKDCHGREDPRMAKDQKRTGWQPPCTVKCAVPLFSADLRVICFLAILGEAKETSEAVRRGGGDTEAAGKTKGN